MQINEERNNSRGQARLRQGSGGQAAIDMTLVVMAMCIILFAALKMFTWFNQCLVERQQQYASWQQRRAITSKDKRIIIRSGSQRNQGSSGFYEPAPLYLIKGEE